MPIADPFKAALAKRHACITLPRMGWGRDLRNVSRRLKTLKDKYENRYPELRRVSNNIFEITRFLLNSPDIVLEPDDKKIFFDCVKSAGSELPDISSIADNIIGFVRFFYNHFAKKLD